MNDIENELKKELGNELKFEEPLKQYVSIKVGGPAQYFYIASKIVDLVKAVTVAYNLKIPYFILGGGYNIVPSDAGFRGIVIKNECDNIAFSGDTSEAIVDSGVSLGKLINVSASHDFGGLEFLCGIPGTVGGSVYGNAGSFGYEIGDFVKSIIILSPRDGKMSIQKKDKKWLNFSYRSSRLKNFNNETKDKPILLTVKLQLLKRRRDEIIGFMQQNIKKKQATQPLNELSAGSFFKNPIGGTESSAGILLDQAGAKKLRVGGAGFSKKHANFLINRKNATANDIRILADKAKKLVLDKYNKSLEEEIEYVGEWQ